MLKAALLFIPLLAGYVFASTWNYTRFRAAREDSQRIYFRAAYYGIFLAIAGFLLAFTVRVRWPEGAVAAGEILKSVAPWKAIGASSAWDREVCADWGLLGIFLFLTLALGSTLGLALNQLYRWAEQFPFIKRFFDPYQRAVEDGSDDIELLLLRALKKTMPVLVTMSNRKVYVGHIVELTEPRDSRKTLRLLPLLSGYREKDIGEVSFTTSYSAIYEQIIACQEQGEGDLHHLDIGDFEIVLPCAFVQSISLFDIAAYNRFRAEAHEQGQPPSTLVEETEADG